ncbi:hypothetical protein Taro_011946 [Colocasia esculenta]|uniref:Uncharacterized protein n=1 Tax=Colocasia esculenta TaxID=4460 RepID=A0A843U7R3_COLES|nr:hypothetical protein [Colocasia esculenta]
MEDAPSQGEPIASAPEDQFQEGLVEDTSEDDEPAAGSGDKGKSVASSIPILTRKAQNRSRKKKIHVHLEPSDVTSIFLSQSTEAKEIGAVKSELQELRTDLGSLKKLVTDLEKFVREHLPAQAPHVPNESVPANDGRPSGPPEVDRSAEKVAGSSGPSIEESWPPGPSIEEFGTSWPLVKESGPSVEESEPSGPSVVEEVTPTPSTPPASFTAPPALEPSKKPLHKPISSPTPFPAASSSSFSSSPIPSSSIPPQIFEALPTSSSGPSTTGPSTLPPPTSSFASLHPPTPPSFIILFPEGASIIRHIVQDIKDEFEEAILHTVLSVSAHMHRIDSQPCPNHASKKRKTSKELYISTSTKSSQRLLFYCYIDFT